MNFISPARRVKKISLKSESTGKPLALVRVENTIAIQLKLHLTTMLSIAVSLENFRGLCGKQKDIDACKKMMEEMVQGEGYEIS